jgi:integrase
MKKVRGKIHYFGKWGRRVGGKMVRVEGDGWVAALEEYKAVADDLHAGRTPRAKADGLTVADLCNHFLTAKQRKRDARELTPRAFMEYKEVTDLIVSAFGKDRLVDDLAADDFGALRASMAERWGPVRLGNGVGRVRSVFKHGMDNGLIEKAVRFGSEFKKPGKGALRRHRANNGPKMIEAPALRKLVKAAPVPLRAMVLLGLNAGFGNMDVATLPLAAVDLERGWLDHPRGKTGIPRRCPLWPETVEAIREALAARPAPKDSGDAGLVFLTERGTRWVRLTEKGMRTDNVTIQYTLLLKRLHMHRTGLGFYTLRHVHRTVADSARDQPAADLIMGHESPHMSSRYRERIDDERLQAVTDHVRDWLFPEAPDGGADSPASETCPPCDRGESEGGQGRDNRLSDPASDARFALRLFVG